MKAKFFKTVFPDAKVLRYYAQVGTMVISISETQMQIYKGKSPSQTPATFEEFNEAFQLFHVIQQTTITKLITSL